jgi:hypothetical protein
MFITKGSYIEKYFDNTNYEDIDNSKLQHDLHLLERSTFNTWQEINKYEGLNAKQTVKTYHISELKK